MSEAQAEEFLTVPEIMALAKIKSAKTVYNRVKKGTLPPLGGIGRKGLFRWQVEAAMMNQANQPKPEASERVTA